MDNLGLKEGEKIEDSYDFQVYRTCSEEGGRKQLRYPQTPAGIRRRDELTAYGSLHQRRHALMGERIGMDIVNMIWDRCVNAIEAPTYEDCKMDLLQTLAMEKTPFTEEEFRNEKKGETCR